MKEAALMRLAWDTLSVSMTDKFVERKEAVLKTSALIGKVTTAEAQQAAVSAQADIAALRKLVEQARVAAKSRPLKLGQAIDQAAKEAVAELLEEDKRLQQEIIDFQTLEEAKIRAAQTAQNEQLTQLERERQEQLAQAETHDQWDQINSEFDQKAAETVITFPTAPPRAEGQRISHDYEIDVTDGLALANFSLGCVSITPKVGEIKALINRGIKQIPGVKWKPILKSGTTGKQPKAIDV